MTLIYVYVFALVLGGILLVTSVVMGGDDASDVDSDLDTSLDTDVDADVDADADVDVDQGHQGVHTDLAATHGTIAGLFTAFLSLRFWTFFAFRSSASTASGGTATAWAHSPVRPNARATRRIAGASGSPSRW